MKQVLTYIAFLLTFHSLWGQSDTITFKQAVVYKKLDDQGLSISKISIDSLKKAPFTFQHLGQLIQVYTGGSIKGYGNGQIATISLRGTGASHTTVFWEGINLQSASLGQVDFSTLPNWFFNHIEIHKGPTVSANIGAASSGGTVRLNAHELNNYSQVGASIGSYGEQQQYVLSNHVTKKWQHRLGASYQQAKNNFYISENGTYQKHGEVFQTQVLGSHKTQLGTRSSLKLAYWYNNNHRNIPNTIGQLENEANIDGESFKMSATWKYYQKSWSSQLTTGFVWDELGYADPEISLLSNTSSNTLQNNWTAKGIIKKSIQWQYVAQHQYYAVQSTGYQKTEKQHRSYTGLSLKYATRKHEFSSGLGIHIVENVSLIPLPSFEYVFVPNKQWQVFLKSARVFKLPSFNDLYWYPLGNPLLKPEDGWTSELGVSKLITQQHLQFKTTVNAFYGDINNWIIWLPNGNSWSPENKQQVINQGLEGSIELTTKLNKVDFTLIANSNYIVSRNQQAKFDNDKSVGKQLIYVPFQTSNVLLKTAYKNTQLFCQLQHLGGRYITSDNSAYLPATDLIDVGVSRLFSWKQHQSLRFSIKLNNLFNTSYQLVKGRPMMGRNFAINLIYNLKHNKHEKKLP